MIIVKDLSFGENASRESLEALVRNDAAHNDEEEGEDGDWQPPVHNETDWKIPVRDFT